MNPIFIKKEANLATKGSWKKNTTTIPFTWTIHFKHGYKALFSFFNIHIKILEIQYSKYIPIRIGNNDHFFKQY
jgi:hypothetical protein